MTTFAGFVGPAYETRSRYQDAQRSINWYPELDPTPGATSALALLPSPGLSHFITPGPVAPVRGMHVSPSNLNKFYVAIGNNLYSVVDTPAIAATLLGTLASNVGPVSMQDNGTTLFAVDGPNGYTVTLATGVFAKVTDGSFFGASRVTYVDGYFIFNKPATQQVYSSNLYAITFDELFFASKEAWPDLLVATWAEHRELWLFGQYTAEVFYADEAKAAAGDFAFSRQGGAFMQHGLAAPHSLAKIGESFAWVGTDERGASSIWLAQGYQPAKISTAALDYELATYATVADAVAFSYRSSGHEFYQVTFPIADKTWVYDITTQMWHQRASMDAKGNLHRHRANCFVNFNGRLLVGDYQNGKIYEYRDDIYADNGDAIPRIRRCPHLLSNRRQVRYNRLEIAFQPGVGLQSGQGSDPKVSLRWSDDGGSTWSNEHFIAIGMVGKYRDRAVMHRMGMARDRIFEVRFTDPVFPAIISAELDLVAGAH